MATGPASHVAATSQVRLSQNAAVDHSSADGTQALPALLAWQLNHCKQLTLRGAATSPAAPASVPQPAAAVAPPSGFVAASHANPVLGRSQPEGPAAPQTVQAAEQPAAGGPAAGGVFGGQGLKHLMHNRFKSQFVTSGTTGVLVSWEVPDRNHDCMVPRPHQLAYSRRCRSLTGHSSDVPLGRR